MSVTPTPITQSWAGIVQGQNGGLTIERQRQLLERVAANLQRLGLDVVRDRSRLHEAAVAEVTNTAATLGIALTPDITAALVSRASAMAGGLGFLDELLPPRRNDLSEVAINPDGSVWLMPKGDIDFIPYEYKPSKDEVWRAVEALLAPLGRSLAEATPSVNAKLPRMVGFGGARVKAVHPRLAPGLGFPAINVRLFEPKPVTLEKLLEWQVAPENVLLGLQEIVAQGYRMFIFGGTATGKTTLLSGLANGIPKTSRVVKIEEPEEIWLDHPHVVTLEARPVSPGSNVTPYTMKDGVDDAMRMSPRWLIVGEVRTGDVALALFRAMMSDHPGLTTFHAESPQAAIHRMAVIMFTDRGVRAAAAKEVFASAVDVMVQVGMLHGRRQIVGVWGVRDRLRGGNVVTETLYLADGYQEDDGTSDAKMRLLQDRLSATPAEVH